MKHYPLQKRQTTIDLKALAASAVANPVKDNKENAGDDDDFDTRPRGKVWVQSIFMNGW